MKFTFESSEPRLELRVQARQEDVEGVRLAEEATGLKPGKHKFKVRAIDAAGNIDPSPAKDKFKVVGRARAKR